MMTIFDDDYAEIEESGSNRTKDISSDKKTCSDSDVSIDAQGWTKAKPSIPLHDESK